MKRPVIRFGINEIPYFQDFGFKRGLPERIAFYPTKQFVENNAIQFAGNGWGAMTSNEIKGTYGNGAVIINEIDLPQKIRDVCLNYFDNLPQNP